MQESFYSSKTDEIWSIWTHAEEVQASIPPGRLLVFDVRIGNIFLTLKKSFPLSRITLKKSPTSLKPFESIKGKGWLRSTLCLPWTSEAFYALPKKQQWSTGSHFFLWKLQMNNYHFELGSIVSEPVEENCLCGCVWGSFDSFRPGPFLP